MLIVNVLELLPGRESAFRVPEGGHPRFSGYPAILAEAAGGFHLALKCIIRMQDLPPRISAATATEVLCARKW